MGPSIAPRRAGSAADWRAIRALCCDTGDDGAPIAKEKRESFGEFWIGPYERHYPGWAFVLEAEGAVIGYLVGCPDTEKMKRAAASEELVVRLAAAERRYPAAAIAALQAYPAHLHVNLAAPFRGRRLGDLLIEAFRAEAGGIHLFCKAGPLPFYLRVGFRELARTAEEPARFLLVSDKR